MVIVFEGRDLLGLSEAEMRELRGEEIVTRSFVNLGFAAQTERGLVVPVIKNADEKNLLGLSRAIDDLSANRSDAAIETRIRIAAGSGRQRPKVASRVARAGPNAPGPARS